MGHSGSIAKLFWSQAFSQGVISNPEARAGWLQFRVTVAEGL
jgi:hypothetical protein